MSISSSGWGASQTLTLSLDASVESGASGAILALWAANRSERLSALSKDSDYNNQSQYDLPAGIPATGFDHGPLTTEQFHTSTDTGAESGASSSILSVWDADRQAKLSILVGGGEFQNKSQYQVPAGVVGSGFDHSAFATEQFHSISSKGIEVGYTYLGTRASGVVLVSPNPEADNPQTYRLEGIEMFTSDGVNEFTATADPTTGEYELPLSDGGEYEIEARHPALEPVTTTISPADGESVPDTDILMPLESAGGGGSAAGLVRRRIG